MESYIVRVYHRYEQHPALMDGVVEIVVTGEKLAFHESGELWHILAFTGDTPARGTRRSERSGSGGKRQQAGGRLVPKTTRRKTP